MPKSCAEKLLSSRHKKPMLLPSRLLRKRKPEKLRPRELDSLLLLPLRLPRRRGREN